MFQPNNTIILYADDGYLSHQVRLALLEKNIPFDEINIRQNFEQLEDLADLNPYNTLPVLVYRELILYQNDVIFEYLEDRYYQNKLLPDTPAEKAQYRQLLWRIKQDWVAKADILLIHADTQNPTKASQVRKELTDSLTTLTPLFARQPFFLSDKFGLCDCVLATILCRLDMMQIELPSVLCRPILHYQQRIFSREAFQKSFLKYSNSN